MHKPRLLLSIAARVAVLMVLATLVSAGDEPTLEQRLEKLAASLEAAREEAHIPGMSIAIVKDDEVVWTRGFGLADVEAQRPADAETIYGIGSTTKAFTATLVGMLVDEGTVTWDDPVTEHLPYFELDVRSDDENAQCTLRDLLSHRHGFARMGLLWFGNGVSREEILRTATGAEPWDDFRKGFHYCNVTYMAAGMAAGAADGSSWEELMVERILEPLGMSSSTLTVSAAQKDPRLALGYKWEEDRLEREKMISIDNVGPAGSVNSNVVDMAQWVRLQLGNGEIDGMQLISDQRLRDTWTPQITMAPGASYGLGWMLHAHKGRSVVEHGGNVDGFTAQVSLMPDENLGYVLLMNQSASPFREASIAMVFDALLDEWPDESAASAGLAEAAVESDQDELDGYVGIYLANFGSFHDAEFEILIRAGRLVLDIPGQQSSDLELPDADGRWTSTLSAQVAVSFQRDEQGAVVGLTVHQGPYSFEIPRQGVALEPEVPAEELEKFVGTYARVEGGRRVKLLIDQGRLTMEDKGQLIAFRTPDAEGHAALRVRADQGATFELDAEGNVTSFVFHGDAGDKLFRRVGDPQETALPTLDDVLALRKTDARIAALKAAGGTRITGKVWIAQAGLAGTLTIYTEGSDRHANHMDFGKFNRIDAVARGKQAWTFTSMRGFDELRGDKLTQALLAHPGAVEGDWSEYFDQVEVVRTENIGERPAHVVRLQKGDLPSRSYWIDADNGDVLQVKQITIEGPVRMPVTITYSDFEEFDGIRRAMRAEIANPASGKMVLTLERVESGLEFGDEVFTLEEAG